MSDLERRIQKRVDAFVDEITGLIREAALESVRDALGGKPANTKSPRRARSAKAKSGGKRSAAELEGAAQAVLSFVADNAGSRADQIARALGTTTKELQLPMRKLVQAGELTTKGQKRATSYFVGKPRRR